MANRRKPRSPRRSRSRGNPEHTRPEQGPLGGQSLEDVPPHLAAKAIGRAFRPGREGEDPMVRRDLVVFPVNPTAVVWAAEVYDLKGRVPAYKRKITALVSRISEVHPSVEARVLPGGKLDESALGDVIDDVQAEPGMWDTHTLGLAREVSSDLGVLAELEAVKPYPQLGILGGDGIIGQSNMRLGDFEGRVISLRNRVWKGKAYAFRLADLGKGVSTGDAGEALSDTVYPTASVGSVGDETLVLMASGPMDTHRALALMPLEDKGCKSLGLSPVVGLLREAIRAGVWNLSRKAWAGSIRFALPTPVIDTKGRDLTGSKALASLLCAPSHSYRSKQGATPLSLDLNYSADNRKILGGSLTTSGPASVVTVTAGKFHPDDNVYTFEAEGGIQGDLDILKGALSLRSPQGEIKTVVEQTATSRACPSPSFLALLTRAAGALQGLGRSNPLEMLAFLGAALSDPEEALYVRSLLAEVRTCQEVEGNGPFLRPLVEELRGEGHFSPSPSGEERVPLLFSGFPKAPRALRAPKALDQRILAAAAHGPEARLVQGGFKLTEREIRKIRSKGQEEVRRKKPLIFSGPVGFVQPTGRRVFLRFKGMRGGEYTYALSLDMSFRDIPEADHRTPLEADPEWLDFKRRGAGGDGNVSVKDEKAARALGMSSQGDSRWLVVQSPKSKAIFRLTFLGEKDGQWYYTLKYGKSGSIPVPLSLFSRVINDENHRSLRAGKRVRELTALAAQVVAGLLDPLISGVSSVHLGFVGTLTEKGSDVPYFLPAEQEEPGQLSYYGEDDKVRSLPLNRRGVRGRLSGQEVRPPTFLQMARMAASSGADALSKQYRLRAGDIETHRNDYTISKMRDLGFDGDQQAALEEAAWNISPSVRKHKKPVSVPLVPGGDPASGALKKAVFTIYGLLDDTAVAVMAQRAQQQGGDPAYAAYMQRRKGQAPASLRTEPRQEPGAVTVGGETAKRVKLRFKSVWANAILAGEKDEEYRKRELLQPGELGVVKVGGRDVFMRLKGTRGGMNAYALSFDGSFQDIHPTPRPPNAPALPPLVPIGGSEGTKANPRLRRNSEAAPFPEYGVFYQKALSISQIRSIIRQERIGAPTQEGAAPGVPIPVNFTVSDFFAPLILSGKKTLTHRDLNLAARIPLKTGQVGVFKRGGQDVFIRCRGPVPFAELLWTLGEGNSDRGLEIYTRREAFSVAPSGDTQALDRKALATLFSPHRSRSAWLKGGEPQWVYDLSLSPEFEPLDGGELVFNPAFALRKRLCEMSGVAELGHIWGEREKAKEGRLPVPFFIAGSLQVDISALEGSHKGLPRALPLGEAKSERGEVYPAGLLLTSMFIPSLQKSKCPDPAAIALVHSEVAATDGLYPSPASMSQTKVLSEYLTQTDWSPAHKTIYPLVGTPWQVPDILGLSAVSTTQDFKIMLEYVREKKQKAEEPAPPTEEERNGQKQDAYYYTIGAALAGSPKGRTSKEVIGGRRAYIAHGGYQGYAVRSGGGRSSRLHSPDAGRGEWGTEKKKSYSNMFTFAASVCAASGLCLPHSGGRRTHVAVLLKSDMSLMPLRDILSSHADPIRANLGILSGDVESVLVPGEEAEKAGIRPGTVYHTQVGRELFKAEALSPTEGGDIPVFFTRADSDELEVQDKIVLQYARHGIDVPDPRNLKKVKEGLEALRAALTAEYRHRANLGSLPDQLEASSLLAERMRADESLPEGLRQGYIEDPIEDINDFARPYLKELAKPNPSRFGRYPRRARARRGSRQNPLTPEGVDAAVLYLETGEDNEDLNRAFKDLQDPAERGGGGPSEGWDITQTKLDMLFPREGRERPSSWSPATRVQQALGPGGSNLVSRAGPMVVTTTDQADSLEAAQSGNMPFDDDGALAWIMSEAGLSLDEAKRMLEEQKAKVGRRGRKGRFTLQPSSALCKLHRKRRLTNYSPPDKVPQSVGSHSVVIWMSPRGVQFPRVMTYRRGSHIDCDMVGKRPEDLPRLLGKGIQSALYWIAEKPRRRAQRTKVYVGRAGDPYLYLVWQPGDPINLSTVSFNLDNAKKRESNGYSIQVYPPSDATDQKERNRYNAAVTALLGEEAAQPGGYREPVRFGADAPEPQVDILSPEGVTEGTDATGETEGTDATPAADLGW